MTSRDFCYWLQGWLEIEKPTAGNFTNEQLLTIKTHLSLVFKHEIDPSMGSKEHQGELNKIHSGNNTNATMRC